MRARTRGGKSAVRYQKAQAPLSPPDFAQCGFYALKTTARLSRQGSCQEIIGRACEQLHLHGRRVAPHRDFQAVARSPLSSGVLVASPAKARRASHVAPVARVSAEETGHVGDRAERPLPNIVACKTSSRSQKSRTKTPCSNTRAWPGRQRSLCCWKRKSTKPTSAFYWPSCLAKLQRSSAIWRGTRSAAWASLPRANTSADETLPGAFPG